VEEKDIFPHMPVKVAPYEHRRRAFEFVCRLFELVEKGAK